MRLRCTPGGRRHAECPEALILLPEAKSGD